MRLENKTPMKRSAFLLICVLIATTASASSQAIESATARQLTITAGGLFSGFNPGSGLIGPGLQASGGGNYLLGLGTYVDVHFTHWIQIEGEARWLRFNQYAGEHEDNYLIGPKVPIHQFGRANVYGKVMIGLGKMTFPNNYGYGTFTALAYGGGVDYKLTRKLSLRAIDFEYQQWPVWLNNSALNPYGFSAGVGYRVF